MKIKKLIVLALSVLMLASMAACSTAAPSAATTAAPTTAATTEATTAPTAAPTTDESTPAPAEKVSMTAFFVIQTNDPDPVTNTETIELEKKTGVHLDFVSVPTDGAHDKLTLMLASGDYPEILLAAGLSNAELVKYGTQEKILIPLNDLIDKYAVNLKQRWAENPSYKTQMTTPDGNIYGIPSADSGMTGHGAYPVKLWMNMDWLKKLGLSVPTTTDELRTVLLAFKTKDPNGNGKADEIPLTGAINTWCGDPYLSLLNDFTYYYPYNLLQLKDGKFTLTANTDGMKEGLKYIAGLYKDGLIDPAAFTQNEQQMAAIGNNKDIVIGGSATCGHLAMFVDTNNVDRAKQYDDLLPLKGSNGYQGAPYDKDVMLSGAAFAITDKCKNPDAAIKMADVFCSMDWAIRNSIGTKGVEWDVADANTTGMDGKTAAQYKYLPGYLTTSVESRNDVWGWSLRLVEPNFKELFQVTGDINDPTNYEARLYQATIKMTPYKADVQQVPPFFLGADDSAKINQIQTPLQDYVKTSIVEFITGKKNVDADWQTYLNGLTKLNYEDYIKLNQAAYDALVK
jgi:putative aldouronate transport system substrate-binding protein